MKRSFSHGPSFVKNPGFTLVELLVAIAILTVIILLSFQMISGTSGAWVRSNSKMAEGREARVAFNSLVSRSAKPRLTPTTASPGSNPAPSPPPVYVPNTYTRHSELRFTLRPQRDGEHRRHFPRPRMRSSLSRRSAS